MVSASYFYANGIFGHRPGLGRRRGTGIEVTWTVSLNGVSMDPGDYRLEVDGQMLSLLIDDRHLPESMILSVDWDRRHVTAVAERSAINALKRLVANEP